MKKKYWLYILIVFLVILSFLVIRPYISTLLFAAAVAYVFYPLHIRLCKKIRKGISAFLLTSSLFILILLALAYGINSLVNRFSKLYTIVTSSNGVISKVSEFSLNNEITLSILSRFSDYIFSMTTKIPYYAISTFIFLVSFYYFLIYGPQIYKYFRRIIPLDNVRKEKLFSDIKRQVNAIVYIQVIIGIAQGILGGIALLIFGYEFPIVGAIIMGILGFIPVIGPPLFYVPVGIFSIIQGNYFQGIGLLVFGVLIISTIDNVLRPFLVGKKARVHPLIVILGLFGGIPIFGVAGILVGPILLSITVTLIKDLEKFHVIE